MKKQKKGTDKKMIRIQRSPGAGVSAECQIGGMISHVAPGEIIEVTEGIVKILLASSGWEMIPEKKDPPQKEGD